MRHWLGATLVTVLIWSGALAADPVSWVLPMAPAGYGGMYAAKNALSFTCQCQGPGVIASKTGQQQAMHPNPGATQAQPPAQTAAQPEPSSEAQVQEQVEQSEHDAGQSPDIAAEAAQAAE